jgi:hypothetical protein
MQAVTAGCSEGGLMGRRVLLQSLGTQQVVRLRTALSVELAALHARGPPLQFPLVETPILCHPHLTPPHPTYTPTQGAA